MDPLSQFAPSESQFIPLKDKAQVKDKALESNEDQVMNECAKMLAEIEKENANKIDLPPLTAEKEGITPEKDEKEQAAEAHKVTFQEVAKKGKAGETLSKVAQFALKFFGKFFPSLKQKYEKYVSAQGEAKLALSKKRMDARFFYYKPYEPQTANASESMVVDSALFLTPEESKKTFSSSKSMAKIAANAQQLKTPDGHVIAAAIETSLGEIRGLAFDNKDDKGNIELVEGKIIPTSLILGNPDQADHLQNIYRLKTDNGEYIIRSGVINTEQKALEFLEVLKGIHNKIGKPLRVISQQLNSFEKEEKLINGQHRWLSVINQKMKEGGIGEIIHINTPSNRFYNFTRMVRGMGAIGAAIESKILSGEKRSKEMNLDSWPTYLKWLGEDIPTNIKDLELNEQMEFLSLKDLDDRIENPTEAEKQLGWRDSESLKKHIIKRNELQNKFYVSNEKFDVLNKITVGIEEAKIRLKETKNRDEKNRMRDLIKSLNAEQANIREEIKDKVNKNYSNLVTLERTLEEKIPGNPDLKPFYEKVTLMRQVLGSQLNIEGQELIRGQEGMTIQLLNDKLGTVSAMNCKSGLDRTGFWHAVKLGMKSVEKAELPNTVTEMVNDWETNTRFMNKLNIRDKENKTIDALTEDDIAKHLQDEFPKGISAEKLENLKKSFNTIVEFRKTVLHNLIHMGIPITLQSTGLVGLKWHGGLQENLIPLNFFPPFVTDEDGKRINLVKYDPKTGEVKGLTQDGRRLITQLSALRGS